MSETQEEALLDAEIPAPQASLERRLEHLENKVSSLEARIDTHDATIDMIISSIPHLEHSIEKYEEVYKLLVVIGEWKRGYCSYNHNGVCKAWRLRENTSIPAARDKNGILRPDVGKNPILCALCPLYRPRR